MPEPVAPSPLIKRPLKFVESDGDGLPLKRRQAQQACAACRRKKKRCPHNTGNSRPEFVFESGQPVSPVRSRPSPSNQHASSYGPGQRSSPTPADQNDVATSAEVVASQLVELSASRFVGDLDPESILIEAAQKRSEQPSLHRNHSDVGTWMRRPAAERPSPVDARGRNAVHGRSESTSSRAQTSRPEVVPIPGLRLRPTDANSSNLGEQLAVGPPEQDYRRLHAIYSEQIQPILPFLEPTDLDTIKNLQNPSPRKYVLRQAVALVAAIDSSATRHLRLEVGGPLLSFQEFHQRLAKAIFSSLDANILTDRIDRIRVLLLLSFFYQPSNPLERDIAPLIFSQAVHFAQSLGIHLRGYRSERMSEDGAVERLFCLFWALDRINAAFHGRPCLLHERDTDRDLDECITAQQEPAFRLFMMVAKMLDSVIWLYRPRNEKTGPVEVPIFESMIVSTGGEKLHPRILTTIEVFYHAVSVLSCRQHQSDFQPTAPPLAHLPQPHLNARRSLSADRIIEIVETCLSSSDGFFTMPFVPYAVALALSVAYRKMRYSRIPMYRLRGKNQFKDVVILLQKLGEVYTSARVNSSLGVSILRELDKTVKEFASSGMPTPGDTTQNSQASTTPTWHAGSARTPTDVQKPSSRTGRPEVTANARELAVGNAAQPAYADHNPNLQLRDSQVTSNPSQQRSLALNPAETSTSWPQLEDIDLFGHFDPAYDLNAVEAALEANLDMGFPQTWTMQWLE